MNTTTQIYSLAHSSPGRVRVKISALKYEPELAFGLENYVSEQAGVLRASANSQSTSLTIEFAPEAFEPNKFLERLRLHDIEPRARLRGKRPLPYPLAILRRATLRFERLVSPRSQFLLGSASLLASSFGAPPAVTGLVLSAAVVPIANRALQTVLEERRLGADGLDAASLLLLIRGGNFFPASVMTFLIGIGEFVRDAITRRCEDLIAHQLALSQQSAWLRKGKKRVRVAIVDLHPGDPLVVYPGELIAFHGTVEDGSGTVVPAAPEEDFEPLVVQKGGHVSPETLLASGKIYARYQTCDIVVPEDLGRQKQKKRWLQRTKLHRKALKTGYARVMPMMGLAGCLFLATNDIHRALTIICYDFLTGIRITLPVAVLSAMYKAGLSGAVIRNASALERLAEVDVVIFARSGTLTELQPAVTKVHIVEGFSLEDVTRFAGAVEQRYNHLVAHAIYSFAEIKKIPVPDRTSSSMVNGLGVRGNVEGHSVIVGSARLMEMENIDMSPADRFVEQCTESGDSKACVAIDGKLAGIIAYQDPLRKDAAEVVSQLRGLGIKKVVMCTGSSQSAADKLAKQAGITDVYARQSAEDKVKLVRDFKSQGLKVAVVGSDFNDAMALESADIAITLGSGAEIARHRADVVLDAKSLFGLVEAIKISREGMTLARQNLVMVSIPNWFGLMLSIFGGAEALSATLLNNGSVIVGVANGLRPLIESDDLEDDDDDELEVANSETLKVQTLSPFPRLG
jgi:P-type Cu2+ transporter